MYIKWLISWESSGKFPGDNEIYVLVKPALAASALLLVLTEDEQSGVDFRRAGESDFLALTQPEISAAPSQHVVNPIMEK